METTYNYDRFAGVAPDPSGGADPFSALGPGDTYSFTNATKIIQIWSVDNNLLIRFSFANLANVSWFDPILIYDSKLSHDMYHSAQVFQVVNEVGGAFATFQVVGSW